MSARCVGEPVSWLRLERLHLGEIEGAEKDRIVRHLSECPACAACLASIEADDARALPRLELPARRPAKVLSLPVRAAAVAGALAAAAGVVLAIRSGEGPMARSLPHASVKGDAVIFSLVREDGEHIVRDEGIYRDGDRFKAVVTCPPGANLVFDLVVYDTSGAAFPLAPPGALACGNEVPLAGAFRLTGADEESVCLFWREGGQVERARLAVHDPTAGTSLCKRLRAAPSGGE